MLLRKQGGKGLLHHTLAAGAAAGALVRPAPLFFLAEVGAVLPLAGTLATTTSEGTGGGGGRALPAAATVTGLPPLPLPSPRP